MIAAVAANGVIGKDNDLAWHLPDDMKYFQETTKGHHVIMGRKNYDSLPAKYKPLPNRTNIILTRQKNFEAENCVVFNEIKEALDFCKEKGEKETFIIGGSQIYEIGLEYADMLYLTEIGKSYEGDTYFPDYNKEEWQEISRVHHEQDNRHEAPMDFVTYQRKTRV